MTIKPGKQVEVLEQHVQTPPQTVDPDRTPLVLKDGAGVGARGQQLGGKGDVAIGDLKCFGNAGQRETETGAHSQISTGHELRKLCELGRHLFHDPVIKGEPSPQVM
jgi:hypothetical protein